MQKALLLKVQETISHILTEMQKGSSKNFTRLPAEKEFEDVISLIRRDLDASKIVVE